MKIMEMLNATEKTSEQKTNLKQKKKSKKTKKTRTEKEEMCYARYMYYKYKYFLMCRNVPLSDSDSDSDDKNGEKESEDEQDEDYDEFEDMTFEDAKDNEESDDNDNNVDSENCDGENCDGESEKNVKSQPKKDKRDNEEDKKIEEQVNMFFKEMMKIAAQETTADIADEKTDNNANLIEMDDMTDKTDENKLTKDMSGLDKVDGWQGSYAMMNDVKGWSTIESSMADEIIRQYVDTYAMDPKNYNPKDFSTFAEFNTYYNQNCVPSRKLPINGITYDMFTATMKKLGQGDM